MSSIDDEKSHPLLAGENSTVINMSLDKPKKTKTQTLTSVFIDPQFESEPFKFKLNTECHKHQKFSEEFETINTSLEQIAADFVYHWTHVPVVLPKSIIFDNDDDRLSKEKLFILPSFNELEEVSIDSTTGNRKKMNKEQLESIKKTGSFKVPSVHFVDKYHEWKLPRWLQKGSETATYSFFGDLSKALSLIIVTAKNRFVSNKFSLLTGFKAWGTFGFDLVDILIGLPRKSVNTNALNKKLQNELQVLLVKDLKVDATEEEIYEQLCKDMLSYVDTSLTNSDVDNLDTMLKIKVPRFYRTPQNLLIDLRLLELDLSVKIKPILVDLLKNNLERKSILNELRQTLIKQYREQNLTNAEIAKMVHKRLLEEYAELLFRDIVENLELEAVDQGIGKLLCDTGRAMIIMRQESANFEEEMSNHVKSTIESMEKKHKVKSLIGGWLNKVVEAEKRRFLEANLYTVHMRTLEKLKEANLYQTAYFVERELIFLKEKKAELIKEGLKVKEPVGKFTFNRMIWQPKNYKILKSKQDHYTMTTKTTYKNDTSYPFWRWKNFFLRTWVYLLNSLFVFGILIPFLSGVSYRALFSIRPFYPGKIVNRNTGKLETDMTVNNRKKTLISRIIAIWTHVRVSRKRFEEQPDSGLLGKSITRFFNIVWNYIFKGFFGTLGLLLIFPLICLSISTLSLFIGLLTPIWYPVFNLVHHLCFVFIFDWELFQSLRTTCKRLFPIFRIFIKLIFCGIIGPSLAVLTALVCPILSVFVLIFALVRRFNRSCLDTVMFHTILKPLARIPATDSFVAKRISGPGLASEHLFQIKPEHALAAVETFIEAQILTAYMNFIKKKIHSPLETYKSIFDPIFQPFSYGLAPLTGPYQELDTEILLQYNAYKEAFAIREKAVNAYMDRNQLKDARLSEKNLDIVVHEATKIIQFHYDSTILKYNKETTEEMFKKLNIDDMDWKVYTEQTLEKIFGTGILIPIEASDSYFNLEVENLSLRKYTEMIANSELRDDLDDVKKKYNPQSKRVVVDIPEESFERLFLPCANPKNIFDHKATSLADYSDRSKNFNCPPAIPRYNIYTSIAIYNAYAASNEQKCIEYNDDNLMNSFIQKSFLNV